MIRVNLLASSAGAPQREWLPAEQRSAALGLLMLMLTGIGVAGRWWVLQRDRSHAETSISVAEVELARLKDAAKLVDQASARRAELTERLSLIGRLRADQKGPVSLLETISRSLPDGLWLMDLTQKGYGVQVEGRATTLTAVTDFVEKMQSSGLFKRPVEIVTTGMEMIEEASIVRFVIKADAANAPDPAPAKPAPGARGTGN